MKGILQSAIRVATAIGIALLVPAITAATPGVSPAGNCSTHNGTTNFPISLNVDGNGNPVASPSTNLNSTCVQGGDTVSVNTSNLPANSTWSFTFATNVALFQNGCQLGNQTSSQKSSCQIVTYPITYTYTYQLTVNGKSVDPKIIVKGGSGQP